MSGDTAEADNLFKELEPQATTGLLSSVLRQEYHEVLGRLRLFQGKHEEAEALFLNSLSETPGKHLSALYHLTLIAQNRGEFKAAQEYRERLLRESPECFYAQRIRSETADVTDGV